MGCDSTVDPYAKKDQPMNISTENIKLCTKAAQLVRDTVANVRIYKKVATAKVFIFDSVT